MRAFTRIVAGLVAGLVCVVAQAQTALLQSDTSVGYSYFDTVPGGSAQRVAVVGQPFSHAVRVATAGDAAEYWLAQLGWNFLVPVQQNDTVMVSFWARKLSPLDGKPLQVMMVVESNDPSYTKSITASVPVTNSAWRRYAIPLRMKSSYAAGGVRVGMMFGVGPQSFEIGGMSAMNYGGGVAPAALPGAFYYEGMEADAPWRAAAQQRIEQHRKGDVTVRVVDRAGNAVANAAVSVTTKRLAFKFGSAVDAGRIASSAPENVRYREMFEKLFEAGVIENHLKWPFWEAWARADAIAALDWFGRRGIPVRGHNLIWPGWGNMPNDTSTLAAAALRARIDAHFASVLSQTAGKLYEWDVMNEPFSNFDVQGRIAGVNGVAASAGVLGNDEAVRWFQQARQLAPQARLVLNDYNMLEGIGARQRDYFVAYVQWLRSRGAPVDAIGLQSHFGQVIMPIAEVERRIDQLATLGLPMLVTEYDAAMFDEQLQANYLRDFMTLVFSRPEFDAFFFWGFWEGAHWEPDAAMYRQDWSERPVGAAYRELVHKAWRTQAKLQSDAQGQAVVRAFCGVTQITAKKAGVGSETVEVNVSGGSNVVTKTLGAGPTIEEAAPLPTR